MNNTIIDFLELKDNEIVIKDYLTQGSMKILIIEKILKEMYCPICSFKMHSKGITIRKVKHPVLQDGFQVILQIRQRRWKCTNPDCKYTCNDSFSFVGKYKQITNLIPYAICFAMKDLTLSASHIAQRFNVSDTTVHNYFLQYVDLPRLPLPEILSVDEVHFDLDPKHKYALVLMNFESKDIIDILPSRLQEETSRYFLSIPLSERNNVKYLVCDMYNPYLLYTQKYFRNSSPVIDYFHVIAWVNNKINLYIGQVKKRYQERDRKILEEKNYVTNRNWQTTIDSPEVFLLKQYKWILLKNKDNIDYSSEKRYISKLSCYLDTYELEEKFYSLDKHFKPLRELKDLYIDFNKRNIGNKDNAAKELRELITIYRQSSEPIFHEFATLLSKYFDTIILSFEVIKSYTDQGEQMLRRISNGPIESFNRKPKDLKRLSRGFSNFEYTRLRILWSERTDAPILAIPKPLSAVRNHTGIKRGPYKHK